MSLTPSTMLDLGTRAPDFSLPDPVTGQTITLDQVAGEKGLVVVFMCNHCPFVKHIADVLAAFAREYQEHGIGAVGISSNDPEHRAEDGPEYMAQEARQRGYTFPYLFDESQTAAKDYHAACTPDIYLFDARLRLVYRGQFDAARPGNDVPVTGNDLRAACDALLGGRQLPESVQKPSIGCNIKWKAGNEPEYVG